jgi:NADH dehydrogenase
VFVRDVAECMTRSLFDRDSFRHNFDLCGPKLYTLRELVRFAAATGGRPRPIIGLSDRLSYLQAAILEHLPGRLLTRDNVRSMQRDTTCRGPLPFGVQAQPVESAALTYLAPSPALRFNRLRWKAGR